MVNKTDWINKIIRKEALKLAYFKFHSIIPGQPQQIIFGIPLETKKLILNLKKKTPGFNQHPFKTLLLF